MVGYLQKMLHDDQVTSAPRNVKVSMRTAVWMVMWRHPAIRAPFNGWSSAYLARVAIKPGISFSASSISLRPKAARLRSATYTEYCHQLQFNDPDITSEWKDKPWTWRLGQTFWVWVSLRWGGNWKKRYEEDCIEDIGLAGVQIESEWKQSRNGPIITEVKGVGFCREERESGRRRRKRRGMLILRRGARGFSEIALVGLAVSQRFGHKRPLRRKLSIDSGEKLRAASLTVYFSIFNILRYLETSTVLSNLYTTRLFIWAGDFKLNIGSICR